LVESRLIIIHAPFERSALLLGLVTGALPMPYELIRRSLGFMNLPSFFPLGSGPFWAYVILLVIMFVFGVVFEKVSLLAGVVIGSIGYWAFFFIQSL